MPPILNIVRDLGWIAVYYDGSKIFDRFEGVDTEIWYGQSSSGHDLLLMDRWTGIGPGETTLFIDGLMVWDYDSTYPMDHIYDVSEFSGRYLIARFRAGDEIFGYTDYWGVIDLEESKFLKLW